MWFLHFTHLFAHPSLTVFFVHPQRCWSSFILGMSLVIAKHENTFHENYFSYMAKLYPAVHR